MIDLRPIFYVVGRILVVLAILMLAPAIIDWRAGLENGADFLESAIITGAVGLMLSVATANGLAGGLNARQAYLMTAMIWGFVPMFVAAVHAGRAKPVVHPCLFRSRVRHHHHRINRDHRP